LRLMMGCWERQTRPVNDFLARRPIQVLKSGTDGRVERTMGMSKLSKPSFVGAHGMRVTGRAEHNRREPFSKDGKSVGFLSSSHHGVYAVGDFRQAGRNRNRCAGRVCRGAGRSEYLTCGNTRRTLWMAWWERLGKRFRSGRYTATRQGVGCSPFDQSRWARRQTSEVFNDCQPDPTEALVSRQERLISYRQWVSCRIFRFAFPWIGAIASS